MARRAGGTVGAVAMTVVSLWAATIRGTPDGRALFVRAWTVQQGLGPAFNATSCVSCHPEAVTPSASADEQSFVWFARGLQDPTGGVLFRRFTIRPDGAITAMPPPQTGTRRRPPRLAGIGLFDQASLAPPQHSQGRFGWKARYPSLTDAVAAALAGEMGLTTSRFPETEGTVSARPEVTDLELAAIVHFVRRLPPPARADLSTPGARVFSRIGCAQCHRPRLAETPNDREVLPFTDLLLHDLGPALGDDIDEGRASGRHFRTAPLWGLRHVQHGYLHDGRARSIADAITAHAGEADAVITRYHALTHADRAGLHAFVLGL